jgi:hypothetical protein
MDAIAVKKKIMVWKNKEAAEAKRLTYEERAKKALASAMVTGLLKWFETGEERYRHWGGWLTDYQTLRDAANMALKDPRLPERGTENMLIFRSYDYQGWLGYWEYVEFFFQ